MRLREEQSGRYIANGDGMSSELLLSLGVLGESI